MATKDFVDFNGNIIEENLHATLESHGLMCPEDKVKLAGIEENANNYIHPETHPPAIIAQDETNRFVTDDQINYWNDKASTDIATQSENGLMSAGDKVTLDTLDTLVGDTAVSEQIDNSEYLNRANWRQNDKSQPNYIKHRICYSEEIITSIFEKTNSELSFLDSGNGYYTIIDHTNHPTFVENAEIIYDTSNLDDSSIIHRIIMRFGEDDVITETNLLFDIMNVDGNDCRYYVFGNKSLITDAVNFNISIDTTNDTGEDFAFIWEIANNEDGEILADYSKLVIFTKNEPTGLTALISENFTETVHKIPEKYLPDGLVTLQMIDDGLQIEHTHAVATLTDAGFLSSDDKRILDNLVELVGQTSVAEQITAAIGSIEEVLINAPEELNTLAKIASAINNDPEFGANLLALLDTKVDKVEGKDLSTNDYTDEDLEKLSTIETGAQVNLIDTVDTDQFATDDKNLTLLDIEMGKVTGLLDEFDTKVDKVEGSRLMTTEEGEKLAGIEEGAQVNYINNVNPDQFSVTDSTLSLNSIDCGTW